MHKFKKSTLKLILIYLSVLFLMILCSFIPTEELRDQLISLANLGLNQVLMINHNKMLDSDSKGKKRRKKRRNRKKRSKGSYKR